MSINRFIPDPDTGQLLTLNEAADKLEITRNTAWTRLYRLGWKADELFTRQPNPGIPDNHFGIGGKKKFRFNRSENVDYNLANELRERAAAVKLKYEA